MLRGLQTYMLPWKSPREMEGFLLRAALFGLMVVALLGLLMRSMPLVKGFPLLFRNVLHAHSHFAFGGWITPILLWMLLKAFPQLYHVAFIHWKRVTAITVIAAYGMLFSFPFGGYGPVSIFFSTLSLAGSFYTAVLCWKATAAKPLGIPGRLLRAGIVFLLLSAIGPLATGPLIATGQQGTPLYFNAIYWYLHFQYNGWFTMVVLSLLYNRIGKKGIVHNGHAVSLLMIGSCLPAFALSLLWMAPPLIYYWMGGLAACMQLAALFLLLKDLRSLHKNFILRSSIAALVIKSGLQLASAFPVVAAAGYAYRNFFIAYLHLVLVGFISLFALHNVVAVKAAYSRVKLVMGSFIFFFILTECLLVADAAFAYADIDLPWMEEALFACSIPLPLCAGIIWWKLRYRSASAAVSLAAAA